MPQDGIQITLHPRLFLWGQFQIGQFCDPTYVLNCYATMFIIARHCLFISKCISLTLTPAIRAISRGKLTAHTCQLP